MSTRPADVVRLLAEHHPHALSVAQLVALSHRTPETIRRALRTEVLKGTIASRKETPNERRRRYASTGLGRDGVTVYGIVEQRPPIYPYGEPTAGHQGPVTYVRVSGSQKL